MPDEHDAICSELDVHRWVDNSGWVIPYCSICGKIDTTGEAEINAG